MVESFEYKGATMLQPWECLMKRIVWKQLGEIRDKKILDFGSGIGVTANYLAEHNDVTAIVKEFARVLKSDGYKDIAFFHHLLIEKK